MYSKELEELIDAALADGVLTQKKKQILLKKAKAQGIDLDEFEMVLDARALKVQQAQSTSKSKKYGNVHTCPRCGAVVQAYMAKCPECGYEFSDVEANSYIKNLSEQIKRIEAQRGHGLTENNVFNHMTGTISKTDKQIIALIKGYPIPTTKTDILEFLAYGIPEATRSIDYYGGDGLQGLAPQKIKDAWKQKCQEIILRAERSLKEDDLTMAEIEKYKKMLKPKIKLSKNIIIPFVSILFLVLMAVLPLTLLHSCENRDKEKIDIKYENLVGQIDALPFPTQKNCDECAYKIQKINWGASMSEWADDYEEKKKNAFIERKNDYISLLQKLGANIDKVEIINEPRE